MALRNDESGVLVGAAFPRTRIDAKAAPMAVPVLAAALILTTISYREDADVQMTDSTAATRIDAGQGAKPTNGYDSQRVIHTLLP